jgi:hypothetical protein
MVQIHRVLGQAIERFDKEFTAYKAVRTGGKSE